MFICVCDYLSFCCLYVLVSVFLTVVSLQNLSLRHNRVTDVGACHIGSALGTVSEQNQRLVSLNLTGNLLTDLGATYLANVSSEHITIGSACTHAHTS